METVSVLFTDLLASTELRRRLGEDRADALQRSHDRLMATAVEAAGGRIVKGLGDGIMAVFDSAAEAVAAAVAIQQGVDQHGRGVPEETSSVRVGVSVGDVTIQDGDCFGAAVVEASRLCAAAQGGQILVADLVRALARGRGGHVFEPVGTLELKGLDEPVAACVVGWEPIVVDSSPVPFPALLEPPASAPYVGRSELLADLRGTWEAVAGGAGSRLVLLVGEPGMGKTRTACATARDAHGAGALVLYGRCDEAVGLPYQPFVEALDWQTAHRPGLPLGRFPGDLRRLIPDLDQRIPELPAPIRSDASAEEHRLLAATASWLSEVSRPHGLVLVVDDLHWAGRPTLNMLLHAVRGLGADPEARVLVLATYRDTDVDRAHPLSDVLGDLRRLPGVERREVDPLSEAEVLALLAEVAGHDLDDEARTLGRRAHADTQGNPFFLGELLRHFIDTGVVRFDAGRWTVTLPDRADVPEGVRDVIGRRLNRLGEVANEVLHAAAVVGREFPLDIVSQVVGRDPDVVLDVLDDALRARLIDELDSGRFRFGHALIHQALFDELSVTRRRRLHQRVVEALERLRPADVAGLAHHSVQAAPTGPALVAAVGYLLAAGEQALEQRAREDARAHFDQVLELADATDDIPVEAQLRARCGLGEIQRDSGDPEYRRTLLDTTDAALEAGVVDLAVRAAVANTRILFSFFGASDRGRVTRLEAVLERLDPDRRRDRALLLAALATELTSTWGVSEHRLALAEHRLALVDEAVALAGQIDDPWLHARVLAQTVMPAFVPDRLEYLVDTFDRLLQTADAAGDPTLRVFARFAGTFHRQYLGDLDGARSMLTSACQLAVEEGVPRMRYLAEYVAVRMIAEDGDLEGARQGSVRLAAVGQQIGEADAVIFAGAVEGVIAHVEGEFEGLVDGMGVAADLLSDFAFARVWQAYVLAETGRAHDARAVLHQHGLHDAAGVSADMWTLASWVLLARTAHVLDHVALARSLVAAVEPHRHRWATVGAWLYGPMALPLALGLHVAGEHRQAAASARQAWDAIVAARLRSHIPMTAVWLVPVLQATGDPTDLALAQEVARHGLAEAESMGMDRRAEQLSSLLHDLPDQ